MTNVAIEASTLFNIQQQRSGRLVESGSKYNQQLNSGEQLSIVLVMNVTIRLGGFRYV